ncbi:MAG: dipeptidase [Spirochaetales bacterium]
MFYIDGHQDLAYGALALGRDFRRTVEETRRRETGTPVPDVAGTCTLGFPEMRAAGIGIVFATVFTLPAVQQKKGELAYYSPDGAREQALAQLDLYDRWIASDEYLHAIHTAADLRRLQDLREDPSRGGKDIGLLLLMENAEPISDPAELDMWWNRGVRIIGPAWARNRYTGSTLDGEGLTRKGHDLLRAMEEHGMVLDLTHSSDRACEQSLDRYGGPIVISHANARALCNTSRMIPDQILDALFAREGVFGLMPANWALGKPESNGERRKELGMDDVVNAISYLRDKGGDHLVALGSDWDGGFGREQLPVCFDSIADIGAIDEGLRIRGFSKNFAEAFMGRNWLDFLKKNLG